MFRNYLLTVLRTWIANKLFTFINIGGLAVGLTCATFIALFVRDELSYDQWIPNSNSLYRVEVTHNDSGQPPRISSLTPYPLLGAMVDQIPEVTAMARLSLQNDTVSVEDRQFVESVDVVDPQFFQVIKLPLLAGEVNGVFSNPEFVVLSQSAAKKFFGTEIGNIGKSLIFKGAICPPLNTTCPIQTHTLMVTGILRDLPHNTQLAADIVIPNTSAANLMNAVNKDNWAGGNAYGYVQLADGADPQKVLDKLKDVIDRSISSEIVPNHQRASVWLVPQLTHFRDVHLTTGRYQSMTPPGSLATVYGFAMIGVLILALACFNFTNLAIAAATLRAREISLRKVMGARRDQIIIQFLGEAILMSLLSFVITISLIQPLLPLFDRFLNKPIALNYVDNWLVLMSIAATSVLVGVLSGLYPAIVLSRFKPALALRNNTAQSAGSGRLRASLVVLQFSVSITLGIAVVVVFSQISHMRHVDLGFRKDDMIAITRLENMSPSNRESFVNALRKYPGITEAALGDRQVPLVTGTDQRYTPARLTGAPSDQNFRLVFIGPEFVPTYAIKLLAGRLLSDAHSGDKLSMPPSTAINILINASAARRFDLSPENAIGRTLTISSIPVTIVGVVGDIKMAGPQQATEETIYSYMPDNMSTVTVHARPEQLSDTLAFIDKIWSAFAPGFPIQRLLLSDEFNKWLDFDARQGQILTLFVGIAIFIACLGLFGLAAFAAERRTKEIGLRKTFGAKTRHVLLLLLWHFSVPVLVANAIAWPVAYYYLHGWLNGYADRISLNPLYFIGAGAAALAIAWGTVYVHAYRMARANPIKALRYE